MMTNDQYLTYANGTIVALEGSFVTRGSSAPDTNRDGHSFMIKSVTRVSAGLYEVVFDDGFPIPELPISMMVKLTQQSAFTKLCEAKIVEGTYSQANRKFRVQVTRSMSVAAWSAGLTVTANTITLATAGMVVAVDATVGSATGGKTIQSGAVAAGKVQVAYDATGIPTLTFQAGECTTVKVQQIGPMVDDPDTGDRVSFKILGSINSAGTDVA